MARENKVCDFCLEEGKGLFKQPEALPDGHYVCKKCRKIIESYGLPLKYDLFQLLVTASPDMTDMIMGDYLEHHTADDSLAKFYPLPKVLMHDGEHCITAWDASITVTKAMIPDEDGPARVLDVARTNISNLADAPGESGSETVKGTLYLTDAALYFLSGHFCNCHRTAHIMRSQSDGNRIRVVEKEKNFTYAVKSTTIFFLRERFYHKVTAAKANRRQNLIYLTGDNEIAITPGVYKIPKNIDPGVYDVTAVKDGVLSVQDVYGRVHAWYGGSEPIRLESGSILESGGEYRLRKHKQ